MIDNYSVAVMVALNDLARRYGVQPSEFVAVLDRSSDDNGRVALRFEALSSVSVDGAMTKVTKAIGVAEDGRLVGTEAEILTRIELALSRAPVVSRGR